MVRTAGNLNQRSQNIKDWLKHLLLKEFESKLKLQKARVDKN